jgi:hypothetical protein
MTASEQKNKGELYSDKDKETILSLLKEYSDKLLRICDLINRDRKTLSTSLVLLVALYSGLMGFVFLYKNPSKLDLINGNGMILLLLIVALVFISGIILSTRQKSKLLMQDAKRISTRLEKVIRVASEMKDHVLENVVSRIELDLRLADAESALYHYTALTKNKSKRLM